MPDRAGTLKGASILRAEMFRDYANWRGEKLRNGLNSMTGPVEIDDPTKISSIERTEILRRHASSNMAHYTFRNPIDSESEARSGLAAMASSLGLSVGENHRSAGGDGVVALQVSAAPSRAEFIPYSSRRMNWHTDGYYNSAKEKIRAFALHCARPAEDGGRNQFLDPEIAYIRLMDENPEFITALSHPSAMTIPENREADGSLRPASIGPVFAIDPQTQKLEMRYTSRTKSIAWRDDSVLKTAVAFLNELLASDEPAINTIKLEAGQGVICNNVLHNRTAFDNGDTKASQRLMLRMRFHNRITGE